MSQQDENIINYSNQAVYNSQSSIKDYSELKTPLNRLTHQLMLSDFKCVEDDPQFITPAKIEESQFNRDVRECYAPRKENPNKAYDQVFKRIKGQQQQQQYLEQIWGAPRQYPANYKGF